MALKKDLSIDFLGVHCENPFFLSSSPVDSDYEMVAKAFESGWGALIPIYNNYLYFKITWGNGWLFLLLLIPFVNVIITIITTFKLARAFGKGFWFGVGLFFLNAIFLGILAFGEPRYQGVPEKDTSFAL